MKQATMILLFLFSSWLLCAQRYETVADRNGSKMLTGFITSGSLQSDSAFAWYDKAYNIYHPKAQVVQAFARHKDSVRLMIVLGTWCPDSHFIVPRVFKIIDSAGWNKNNVTMLAVDRSKKDKTNLAALLHITHVPTIIIFKNGKEIGRVAEYGQTGRYDEELAAILTES